MGRLANGSTGHRSEYCSGSLMQQNSADMNHPLTDMLSETSDRIVFQWSFSAGTPHILKHSKSLFHSAVQDRFVFVPQQLKENDINGLSGYSVGGCGLF